MLADEILGGALEIEIAPTLSHRVRARSRRDDGRSGPNGSSRCRPGPGLIVVARIVVANPRTPLGGCNLAGFACCWRDRSGGASSRRARHQPMVLYVDGRLARSVHGRLLLERKTLFAIGCSAILVDSIDRRYASGWRTHDRRRRRGAGG